eukprot:8433979-Alexandrium_andersonii.AAC.1
MAVRGQAPGVHRDQEPVHGPVPLLQMRPEAGLLPEGELHGGVPGRDGGPRHRDGGPAPLDGARRSGGPAQVLRDDQADHRRDSDWQ